MEMLFWFCSLIVVVITLCYLWFWPSRSKLPPGPSIFHHFRNVGKFGGDIHMYMNSLGYKYGPLVTLRLGSRLGVLVNDPLVAREALVTQGIAFADRKNTLFTNTISRNEQNIICGQYTKDWEMHRKIACNAFHLFGEGMLKLESQMMEEVKNLSSTLSNYKSSSADVRDDIETAVLIFICHTVFGKRYEREDSELLQLKKCLKVFTGLEGQTKLLNFVPLLYPLTRFLKPKWLQDLEEQVRVRDKIFEERLIDIKAYLKEGIVTNYTEALLQVSKDEGRKVDNATTGALSNDRLIMSMFDIFLAGLDTTAASLQWAILYMELWPDVQKKVYEEIEALLGKPSETTFVQLNHRESLPYTEATLTEVLRFSSVSFVGVPHMTTKDISFHGYQLPKGTGIVFNLYHIHHNEKYFPEPYNFIPERFIDNKGHCSTTQHPHYLPFSAGPRRCLGEPLAKANLFIVFSNLIHRFRFKAPPDSPPRLGVIPGPTLSPKPYHVIMEERF